MSRQKDYDPIANLVAPVLDTPRSIWHFNSSCIRACLPDNNASNLNASPTFLWKKQKVELVDICGAFHAFEEKFPNEDAHDTEIRKQLSEGFNADAESKFHLFWISDNSGKTAVLMEHIEIAGVKDQCSYCEMMPAIKNSTIPNKVRIIGHVAALDMSDINPPPRFLGLHENSSIRSFTTAEEASEYNTYHTQHLKYLPHYIQKGKRNYEMKSNNLSSGGSGSNGAFSSNNSNNNSAAEDKYKGISDPLHRKIIDTIRNPDLVDPIANGVHVSKIAEMVGISDLQELQNILELKSMEPLIYSTISDEYWINAV